MPILTCLFCLQASAWTEEEMSLLSRLMGKFPGGSPGRWEKIAHELGRSVTDVSLCSIVWVDKEAHSSDTQGLWLLLELVLCF